MARLPRTSTDATWHHVMNRGARRLPVFGDDRDRQAFLDLLRSASAHEGAEVHAYALMGNHFHLLIRAQAPVLGRTMKSLAGSYTQRFNKKYGLDGALFRGRYRSKPIDNESYLFQVVRYVHRNPVSKLRRAVHLVDFRWTSHPAYLGGKSAHGWVHTEWILGQFSGDVVAYRALIESAGFSSHSPSFELGPAVRTLQTSDVDAALGAGAPEEGELINDGRRRIRNPMRSAALLLCRDLTDETADALALRYGFASASSVRSATSRARDAVASDPAFAQLVADAHARLAARFRRAGSPNQRTHGTGV